jgi:hypothetical protein
MLTIVPPGKFCYFIAESMVGGRVKHNLIHVTPAPFLARLKRFYYWMFAAVKMFGGVLVLGTIATTDVPAFQAKTQVNPAIARLQAIFTTVRAGLHNLQLVIVATICGHLISSLFI